jgi:hypothetical protein
MSSQLDYWVSTLGEAYAPTLAFELTNGLLGLAWQNREKEIAGTTYMEFILATIVEPGGHVQHYTTYAVPKNLVKRMEPYKWRRESALSDLFSRLKGILGKGEKDAR